MSFQCLMYPLRLALEICVERAGDDARVLRPFVMQADKVLAVQDQDRPLIAAGFRQNLRIWNCFFGSARISNRQHLMSQPPTAGCGIAEPWCIMQA